MTGKVALITGASSGIGQATAMTYLQEQVHVTGVARRMERLNNLVTASNAMPQPHGSFFGFAGDVNQPDSLQAAVGETIERFGRLDILVANAGIGHRGPVADADWQDLEMLLHTNIDGVLHSIRAAVPAMREVGGGHIFIISSVSHNLVSPFTATYAASKAFVSSMARSLRLELEDENIYVTDVLIGRVLTEFNEKRLGKGARPNTSVPSMAPERVANAIVRATGQPRRTISPRLFDRLTMWGNALVPDVIGRIAKRQYQ